MSTSAHCRVVLVRLIKLKQGLSLPVYGPLSSVPTVRSIAPELVAPKVQTYLEGRQIRKVIVVPKRLVDIVCG